MIINGCNPLTHSFSPSLPLSLESLILSSGKKVKRSTEARNQSSTSSAPSWLTGSTVKSSVNGEKRQVDDRVQVGSSSGTVGTPGGSSSGGSSSSSGGGTTFSTSRSMVPENSANILGGSSFQNVLPLNSNGSNISAISGSNATESGSNAREEGGSNAREGGIIELDHEPNILDTLRHRGESIHPSGKGTSAGGLQQLGSTSFTTDSSLLLLQTQVTGKDGENTTSIFFFLSFSLFPFCSTCRFFTL